MWGKIIAGILVLIGTQGFGIALSQEMKSSLYHMNEQKRMLLYMEREISFLHRPMQEIFLTLSERMQKPYDTFLKTVGEKMDDGRGRSLVAIWEEETKKLYKNRCYPKEVFTYLIRMKRCFYCEEDEMQRETFAMLRQELEEELDKVRRGKEEKDRLIRTLSLLAGILCIVIFV